MFHNSQEMKEGDDKQEAQHKPDDDEAPRKLQGQVQPPEHRSSVCLRHCKKEVKNR